MGSLGASGNDLVESCRDLLAAGHSDAATSWGPFDLPLRCFEERAVERIVRRLSRSGVVPSPEAVRDVAARTPLADLALAVACSDEVPGSWETLVGRLSPRLVGLARKHGADATDARTLADDVLAEMSLPASHGRVRRLIDTYEGAGSLFGWAAVILVRRLHRIRSRGAGRGAPGDSGGATQGEAADRGHSDPAEVLAAEDTVRRFRIALTAAWAALPGRERLALSCRYGDGTPQTRIATLLRVSEPHTSRILAAAVARLRSAVEQALGLEARSLGAAWPALAEVLRTHLVSADPDRPLPLEDLPEIPRTRGPR